MNLHENKIFPGMQVLLPTNAFNVMSKFQINFDKPLSVLYQTSFYFRLGGDNVLVSWYNIRWRRIHDLQL
jgi:hypothetical protein